MRALAVIAAAASAGLAASAPASAQFPGDVFFQDPSIAVAEGGQGELVLNLFAGADPLGAADVTITYDPERLEIVAVDPIEPTLSPVFEVNDEPGRTTLVTANAVSLDAPDASAALARLTIRPLAPEGERVLVSTEVRSAFTTSVEPYASSQGFGAEINVGAAAGASSSSTSEREGVRRSTEPEVQVTGDPVLLARARRLRPEGVAVALQLEAPDGGLKPVLVVERSAAE